MRIAVIATAVCLSAIGLSLAADAEASIKKATNIPAQPLVHALARLAKERGLALAYRSETVGDLQTAGAVGEFTTDEALARILSGTGLTYRYLDDKTVTIVPVSAQGGAGAATKAQVEGTGGASSDPQEAKKGFWDRFLVAQVDQGRTASEASVKQTDEQASKKKPVVLEEVIVTGSRIPTVAGQQVQPVRSYTREDIERSGQTTVADFLNNLPEVSISSNEFASGSGMRGQTTVQLHGLPVGTTLILLNGRRVETSAVGFFDLSNIPVSAIERVEVMPVGASAIYGADALGGAVNIILGRNPNGLEVTAKFGHAADINDTDINLGWGSSWERGSVSLLGTYQDRGGLLGRQRTVTSMTDFPADAPSFNTTEDCSPGNVYSLDGLNLPGLSSSKAGIPTGVSGTPTIQQFAATAGKLNRCNYLQNVSLIPQVRRAGALLSAHYQIAGAADLFAEILFSHQQVKNSEGSFVDASGGSYGGTTLAANNPYNPFGKDVGVSFAYLPLLTSTDASAHFMRPLIGIRGDLFSAWHYETTAFVSTDRYEGGFFLTDNGAVQAALSSSNPATALNPFASGAPGTAQLLQSLVASAPFYNLLVADRMIGGQALLRGPLSHLPAGPVATVLGIESSREKEERGAGGANTSRPFDLQRNSYAVFSEARLPLLADQANAQLGERLALTLAGRYDHTNDFGGKTTWQSGLFWRATETISLNGSYGVSYRAPHLKELGGGVDFTTRFQTFADPLRGGEIVNPLQVYGSNANLKPETGDSRTLGIVYASWALPGLETSLTYFAINISDYIGRPAPISIINNPNLYPGGVVRGPATPQDQLRGFPGPITQVNTLYFNYGDLRVAGFNVDARYAMDTRLGQLTPSLAVANIYKWQSALAPGAPPVNGVSQAIGYTGIGFAPRWKGTAALNWKLNSFAANLAGRYIGRYKDYQDFVPNSNELGNSWVFDLNVRYDAGRAFGVRNGWLAGSYVSLGSINMFDKTPAFTRGSPFYDWAEYDIRGRIVYAQIGVKF
jgi:iron complex outermembrane recepter protein